VQPNSEHDETKCKLIPKVIKRPEVEEAASFKFPGTHVAADLMWGSV